MLATAMAMALGASMFCQAVVPWGTATLRIDDTGRVASLRVGGRELALPDGPFCQIVTDAGTLAPTGARKTNHGVAFEFPGGVEMSYRVEAGRGFSHWEVASLTGLDMAKVKSILLCNLHLTGLKTVGRQAGLYYDDATATAVMATHINVLGHVDGDAKAPFLRAQSYAKHGLRPAGFGILACPKGRFVATIDAFEKATGLPNPHPGGVWSKVSPWTKRSYLFVTRFGEKDTDDVIRWAKRGGFDMILLGQSWAKSCGTYAVNTSYFPKGLPSLVSAVGRLHKAGFHVGLHFLAAAVYLNDPLVTPVPDPRLYKDARATLAADIDAKTTDIPTVAAPTGFATEDGGYMGKGMYVQIGEEIIHYSTVRSKAPFGLGGCQRGALGTRAAPHKKGEPVEHIMRSYGYFLHDLDTGLSQEVANNLCRVANAIGADMLYFDGSELLQGDHWYYNAKLQNLYYRGLKNKNVLLQGSSWSHYSWHLISRTASADGSGDVKKYLDERMGGFKSYEAEMMPLDIGWYYVYSPEVTADQFEYILQKCLGWNSSISVQTNPENLRHNPEMPAIMDLVRTYDNLRLGGKVPEATRKILREPGREYRLVGNPPRLRRTVYGHWKPVNAIDGKQNVFAVDPIMPGTRLGVQVRCLGQTRPGPAYRSAKALTLENFDDVKAYSGTTSDGVTQKLTSVADGAVEGGRCGEYTATSTRAGGDGWSAIGKHFQPALDLSWHKGIGLWLKGDGQGGAFKLQLDDDKGGATDYYITNNFTDWRYFQLLRPTAPQPKKIDYSHIAMLMFYYNGLPAKKTVTCWIDDVKALAELDHPALTNPEVSVGGRRLVFPCTLRAGERLVYYPGEAPYIIPADQQTPQRKLAKVADLPLAARSKVTFSADQPMMAGAEVRMVQDCPEELKLR